MARALLRLFAALAFAAFAAGCFEAPTPECAFLCGQGGACPDGYTCASDLVCKRADVPDEFDCGFTGLDAAPADAAPDAPPDAAADAPPDAG